MPITPAAAGHPDPEKPELHLPEAHIHIRKTNPFTYMRMDSRHKHKVASPFVK